MRARIATVRSLAKLNLSLQVLGKRPDGYHELRTVFQTISLADRIQIEYAPARRTSIEINSDIPDNLVVLAAKAVLDASKITAAIQFRLTKRIPMGAGLGGGSSNAAAVLLALPALSGKPLPMATLGQLGAELGSDVPFFLEGGTALGIGRGAEIYPLPFPGRHAGLVVAPAIHVSTPEAYRALNRPVMKLTSEPLSRNLNTFQSFTWGLGRGLSQEGGENDFEEAVFRQHPLLRRIKSKLLREGARQAMMTGSGAAIFGHFPNLQTARRAKEVFHNEEVFSIHFVSRDSYRAMWRRQLGDHPAGESWPPRSRYGR